jgi:sodium/potassium-transporting ATPase subunit alpha
MNISHAIYGNKICIADPYLAGFESYPLFDTSDEDFIRLQRCAMLCNTARFDFDEDTYAESLHPGKTYRDIPIQGDATTQALLRFNEGLMEAEITPGATECQNLCAAYESKYRMMAKLPFNSTNKYMATARRIDSEAEYDERRRDVAKRDDGKILICFKGAPEKIYSRCGFVIANGKKETLHDANLNRIQELQLELAKKGERVLGFAECVFTEAELRSLVEDWDDKHTRSTLGGLGGQDALNELIQELLLSSFDGPLFERAVFLGLISLCDPPRPEVPQAIAELQGAGIQTIMASGDHPVTCKATAERTGLLPEGPWDSWNAWIQYQKENLGNHGFFKDQSCLDKYTHAANVEIDEYRGFYNDNALVRLHRDGCPIEIQSHLVAGGECIADPVKSLVIAGTQLDSMTDEDWMFVRSRENLVFARLLPGQKSEVVERLRCISPEGSNQTLVALIGDGVNDAPALKTAHVGICMGTASSDVARDAANVILLDDNFCSILMAVREGRLMSNNMKKSIVYSLASNVPQLLPFVALVVLQIPLAMEVATILVIDFITGVFPTIALCYEPAEYDIMSSTHVSARGSLVSSKLLLVALGQFGVIQAITAFTSYLAVFAKHDLALSDIMGTGFRWTDEGTEVVCGLNYDDRMIILREAQTAFFITLVIAQCMTAFSCRTRILSVCQQRFNMTLFLTLCVSLGATIFLIYKFDSVLIQTAPVDYAVWGYALFLGSGVLIYDELRKLARRRGGV